MVFLTGESSPLNFYGMTAMVVAMVVKIYIKGLVLLGKILTGNQSYFHIKIMGFSCKSSLEPIH